MVKNKQTDLEGKLEEISALLQHLLALELAKNGVSTADIAKHLHIAKASAVKLLRGVKKEK